jgi:putative FmdB family regulatory protein
MPIYEYRCAACGHQEDHLRKVTDPPLTKCPACGRKKYEKQLTAAGFQLKGSGWYATDFKSAGKKAADGKAEAKPEAAGEAKAEAKTEAKAAEKSGAGTETKTEARPAKKTPASTTN